MILAVPVLSAPGWANRARRVQLGEELVGTRKGSTPRNGLTVTQPPVYAAQVSRTAMTPARSFGWPPALTRRSLPLPCPRANRAIKRHYAAAPSLRPAMLRTKHVCVCSMKWLQRDRPYKHPQLWPMYTRQDES